MAKFSDNSMAAIQWDELEDPTGALAAGSATTINSRVDSGRLQGFRVLRTEWFFRMKGLSANEGPVLVGLAHDLTAAEIQECLGADPQRSNDPTLSPRTMRPVWPMALFENDSVGNQNMLQQGVTTIGWSIPEGTNLVWWQMNRDTDALQTGGTLNITAKHFGVWLKD